jgi:hypothetical protein
MYITSPKHEIKKIIKSPVPAKKGYTQVIRAARVPVIIESFFTINGNNMHDKSLYLLEFLSVIGDKEYESPTIEIKGLIFRERLDPSVDIKKYINQIWKESKALGTTNIADAKNRAAD